MGLIVQTARSLSFLTLNSSCNSESSDVTTAEYTASNTLLSTVPQYRAVSPSTLFFVGLPRACRVEECTHQTVVQWLFKQRLFCRAGFAKIGPHPQTLMWWGGVKRDQPPSHLEHGKGFLLHLSQLNCRLRPGSSSSNLHLSFSVNQ